MVEDINTRANQIRAEYQRRWRAANKNKVREYNARYWRKKALQKAAELKKLDDNVKKD